MFYILQDSGYFCWVPACEQQFLDFSGQNVEDRDFSTFSSVFPIKPFTWSSSAIHSQYERIQTLLENIWFPMIKVHNGQEIFRLQPSFFKLVGQGACSFQAASGKETGSSQDHLVCFHLLTILTGQSHIIKVVVLSKASNAILMFSWKLFH